jgi:hypothetical protein
MAVKTVQAKGLVIPKANPGINWPWISNMLAIVIKPILDILTPMLRTAMETAVRDWWKKAEATDNPWDNFLVEVIAKALSITL